MIGLTSMCVNGTIHPTTHIYGGVGAPVGFTVFKTAGGSLGAVPGGFDSHTPLPVSAHEVMLCCLLTHGFADSAKLCFPFGPAKLCFPYFVHKNTFSYFEIFNSFYKLKRRGVAKYPLPVTTSQHLKSTAARNQKEWWARFLWSANSL